MNKNQTITNTLTETATQDSPWIHMLHHANKFIFTLLLSLIYTSAAADWAEVGASYQCDANRFSLYASVQSNYGNVSAPKKSLPLRVGENKIICRLSHSTVSALIWLSGPGQSGECGAGGRIQIMELKVADHIVVPAGEPMLLYCSGEPTITSIHVETKKNNLSTRTCKGTWNWGNSYEEISCDEKLTAKFVRH